MRGAVSGVPWAAWQRNDRLARASSHEELCALVREAQRLPAVNVVTALHACARQLWAPPAGLAAAKLPFYSAATIGALFVVGVAWMLKKKPADQPG